MLEGCKLKSAGWLGEVVAKLIEDGLIVRVVSESDPNLRIGFVLRIRFDRNHAFAATD